MGKYIIAFVIAIVVGFLYMQTMRIENELSHITDDSNNSDIIPEKNTDDANVMRMSVNPAPHQKTSPQSAIAEDDIESASDDPSFGIVAGQAPTGAGMLGMGMGMMGGMGMYGGMGMQPRQDADFKKKIVMGSVISYKDGSPIADAAISVEGNEICRTPQDGAFYWKCEGRASIEVTVTHPDYYPVTQIIPAKNIAAQIRMIPLGALAGRVLDKNDDVVVSSLITLESSDHRFRTSERANRTGEFFYDDPPDGSIRLIAEQRGYQDKGEGHAEFTPPFDEVITLRLEQAAFTVSGRVLRSDTKQPEKNITIMLQSVPPGNNPTMVTNDLGEFEFTNVHPGMYFAHSNEIKRGLGGAPGDSEKMFRVQDQDIENLEVLVTPMTSIEVFVQDKDGNPVQGAKVNGFGSANQKPPYLTNAQGRFYFEQVMPPSSLKEFPRISAYHDELGYGESEPLRWNGEHYETAVITIIGMTEVKGVVVNEGGEPMSQMTVEIHPTSKNMMNIMDPNLMSQCRTTTREDGRFDFRFPFSADRNDNGAYYYMLFVTKMLQNPSVEKPRFINKTISLMPGKSAELTLVWSEKSDLYIKGRVTDDYGKPIPSVGVVAFGPMSSHVAITDKSGEYVIPRGDFGEDLQDGFYDLEASTGELTGRLYHVAAGTKNVDIVVKPDKWIVTGKVIDADTKQPVSPISITERILIDGARARVFEHSFSAPDGSFYFKTNYAGQRVLTCIAEGYQTTERLIDLNEDSPYTVQVNMEMQPDASVGVVEGTLQPPEGASLVQARIYGIGSVDCPNNTFRFENVPVGKYVITFYALNIKDHTVFRFGVLPDVEVRAGESVNLGRIDAAQLQQDVRTR